MSSAPRVLNVSINGRPVGQLRELNDIWTFEYDESWLQDPDAFSLSNGLSMTTRLHTDGSSVRPVQWYFDNLLPEELLREVLAKEAKIDKSDAFDLLRHFGSESAGSLVLLEPSAPVAGQGLKPLTLADLQLRIKNLPHASLTQAAPKRMSLAGAQHKMVVVREGNELFEPLSGTPSTHILKPNSLSPHYPSSVMNEFFTMRLADAIGLTVPAVDRLYAPAPVYLVDRFDRTRTADKSIQRIHIIDTCQLLNKSRAFKYQQANLDTLAEAIKMCRAKTAARIQLYRWLLFNVLIGNGDNHLKNISFTVNHEGVSLAPFYDLLCTAVYATQAYAQQVPTWPRVELAVSIEGANYFNDITRDTLLKAGASLGLNTGTALRELEAMEKKLPASADALIEDITQKFEGLIQASPDPQAVRALQGGEMMLLRAIRKIIIWDMLERIKKR
ncbi:MAG: HipA domain-containing protein [Burkholderiaceae bacterium]|nr:HipA domain-containing protein [Burkholderiaceae bacterium]